jgi:hypothetical protein
LEEESKFTFGLQTHNDKLQKLLITYGNDACPHYVGVWGKGGKEKTNFNKNSSQ